MIMLVFFLIIFSVISCVQQSYRFLVSVQVAQLASTNETVDSKVTPWSVSFSIPPLVTFSTNHKR